ncbi:MAG: class I SAM-dependent methyltransferase [Brevinematales bacterium]|nr:class I SAM-dependent methyltransferase [Brevinematales bacterium]
MPFALKIVLLVLLSPIIIALLIPVLVLHTLVRIVRKFWHFPMPEFMAPLIDNKYRHKYVQPPGEMAIRHGLTPGMHVLEVGPGNATYTIASSKRVGPKGGITAIDIEPKMIERVKKRLAAEGIVNVEAVVADVYQLPFPDESFDLCYMMMVIGEIPDSRKAVRDIRRVLKPGGLLTFTEILVDPDYPLKSTLIRRFTPLGFKVKEIMGGFVHYTIIFQKI